MRRFSVPSRRRELWNYRRPCDRCGWDGWTRSQLSREVDTGLLICIGCKPDESRQLLHEITDFSDNTRALD